MLFGGFDYVVKCVVEIIEGKFQICVFVVGEIVFVL